MKYVSTRGLAPALSFEDAMLAGLARDGGLYVPEAWPELAEGALDKLAGAPYERVASTVMRPFVGGEIPDPELESIIDDAYARFAHRQIAPLVQIGPNEWLAELFHGPTLAFKDVAMQVLARLMDRALQRRGRRATIVAATSGDTGGAAIEAFRGRSAIDVFILFPQGRVSDVQRRQMTTAAEPNVHALAVKGSFDDCQSIVKALFNDHAFRDRMQLAGVNSINWARILAQVVYYVTTSISLGAPGRRLSFTVPTGNFGDIFAGYVAKRMGVPIGRLIIATNANDILVRALRTGRYEPKGVVATTSPSMDIQISSNFERLLFEITGRDAVRVRELMAAQSAGPGFTLREGERERLCADFSAEAVSERAVAETIVRIHREAGAMVIDPHTAVGVVAAGRQRDSAETMVVLATAHPAKFPDAIEAAIGERPPEPRRIAEQRLLTERISVLANDVGSVASHIAARARLGGGQPA